MVKYAFYRTRFGFFKIGYNEHAVVSLKLSDTQDCKDEPSAVSELAYSQLQEYFDGKRKGFDFPFELHGTQFQIKAWKALCDIPYGETRTYKDIAAAVGSPKAFRAVGMANHNNPIWIAVPCHRVIGSNGDLTGYAGGLDMKRALIELERNNRDCNDKV